MKYLDLEVFWHVVIFRKKVNIFFFKENVNKLFPQNIFERLNAGQWKPHGNAPALPVQNIHMYFHWLCWLQQKFCLGEDHGTEPIRKRKQQANELTGFDTF